MQPLFVVKVTDCLLLSTKPKSGFLLSTKSKSGFLLSTKSKSGLNDAGFLSRVDLNTLVWIGKLLRSGRRAPLGRFFFFLYDDWSSFCVLSTGAWAFCSGDAAETTSSWGGSISWRELKLDDSPSSAIAGKEGAQEGYKWDVGGLLVEWLALDGVEDLHL